MKFSLYSKKNVLDEMQEQTLRKIGERGFCLMWGGLLAAMVIQLLTGNADKAIGEWVVFMAGCVYTGAECIRNGLWDRHLSPSMGANAGLFSAGGRGGYGAVWPGLWLLDGRCVYWCFDRSALLCAAPILCISGEEEPEKAGR